MERLPYPISDSGQAVDRTARLCRRTRSRAQGHRWRLPGRIFRWQPSHRTQRHLRGYLCGHGARRRECLASFTPKASPRDQSPSLSPCADGMNPKHKPVRFLKLRRTEPLGALFFLDLTFPSVQYNILGLAIDRRYIRLYCSHPSDELTILASAPYGWDQG